MLIFFLAIYDYTLKTRYQHNAEMLRENAGKIKWQLLVDWRLIAVLLSSSAGT